MKNLLLLLGVLFCVGMGIRGTSSQKYVKAVVANYRSGDEVGTVTAWFKLAVTGETARILAVADEGSDNHGFNFTANWNNSRVQTSNKNTGNTIAADWTPDKEWHYAGFQSNGSAIRIWVDGIEDTSLTIVNGSNTGDWFADVAGTDNLTIGAYIRATLKSYNDAVYFDVRVYDRPLSDSEHKKIYFTKGADGIVDGLVGWWRGPKLPGHNEVITENIEDLAGSVDLAPINGPLMRRVPMRKGFPINY